MSLNLSFPIYEMSEQIQRASEASSLPLSSRPPPVLPAPEMPPAMNLHIRSWYDSWFVIFNIYLSIFTKFSALHIYCFLVISIYSFFRFSLIHALSLSPIVHPFPTTGILPWIFKYAQVSVIKKQKQKPPKPLANLSLLPHHKKSCLRNYKNSIKNFHILFTQFSQMFTFYHIYAHALSYLI